MKDLQRFLGPLPEGVAPGGLRGPLDPEMAEAWIDGLKNTGRAGQMPSGPFYPSPQQWKEIIAADGEASKAAGEAIGPATQKATTMGRVSNWLSLLVAAEAAYAEYKDSSAQTVAEGDLGAGMDVDEDHVRAGDGALRGDVEDVEEPLGPGAAPPHRVRRVDADRQARQPLQRIADNRTRRTFLGRDYGR